MPRLESELKAAPAKRCPKSVQAALSWRLLVATIAFQCGTVDAADDEGRFAVKGAGLFDCARYVEEFQSRSATFFLFGGWLDGYLTALNEMQDHTFDVTAWESTDLLASMIEAHCRRNPDHNFSAVVRVLAKELTKTRLQQAAPLMSIPDQDEGAVVLYRESVMRVQTALKAEGHYEGAIDGDYGERSRSAMRSFQRSLGLEETGIPDQGSLYRLLREDRGSSGM